LLPEYKILVSSVFFLTIFEALVYDQNNQFFTGMIRSLPEIKKIIKDFKKQSPSNQAVSHFIVNLCGSPPGVCLNPGMLLITGMLLIIGKNPGPEGPDFSNPLKGDQAPSLHETGQPVEPVGRLLTGIKG
jgi:hypothetical protein